MITYTTKDRTVTAELLPHGNSSVRGLHAFLVEDEHPDNGADLARRNAYRAEIEEAFAKADPDFLTVFNWS